jgi:hypothetical protein
VLDAGKRGRDLGPQKPMGIGDQPDEHVSADQIVLNCSNGCRPPLQ